YPYGGGAGMVLTPQPIFDAVEDLTKETERKPRVVLMCPQGERFTQKKAEELAEEEHLIFVCGHYEGYDERIREHLVTDEISIGDYVLTGGELASMVITDSVVRLLPGVLGNHASQVEDSFSTGLLEHPHYTRPADFRGMKVPDVLMSGNHKNIDEWRHKESLRRTYTRRPDLLEERELSKQEKKWLEQIKEGK
ncbi:tRNA (guanosine(37)-N1)-methyltransferase TrmD, partial [Klebsiella pneumoniae]